MTSRHHTSTAVATSENGTVYIVRNLGSTKPVGIWYAFESPRAALGCSDPIDRASYPTVSVASSPERTDDLIASRSADKQHPWFKHCWSHKMREVGYIGLILLAGVGEGGVSIMHRSCLWS
jgi:hypothetical protein